MSFILGNIGDRAVLVEGDSYFDVETLSKGVLSSDPMQSISSFASLHLLSDSLKDSVPTGKVSSVNLGPPVPRPQKSFAVGLNFKSHADESNMQLPTNPLVFTKFPSCLVGANSDIRSESVV